MSSTTGPLDLRPDTVPVFGYAGDTLTIVVTVPTDYINGRTFAASLRPNPDSPVIDAEFVITEPTEVDGPAYLTLHSAVTQDLASGGTLLRVRKEGVSTLVMRYSGVWDCQLSNAGSDPVKTVVKGTLTIDQDVTRE